MKKQINLKSNQAGRYTYEDWFNSKVEYKRSLFSSDDRLKIYNKSKELLLAEVDRRFKKEVYGFEKSLSSVPSREKFLQLQIDIIHRILFKDIDYRNDCRKVMFAGREVIYYKTGLVEWDIKQIESVRNNCRLYLEGNINYMARTPALDSSAEDIILAILHYKLDEWLKGLRDDKISDKEPFYSLLKYARDKANQKTLDNVLKICKDNLHGNDFDLMSYSALYLVIFTKYHNIFKEGTCFVDLQKECDKYFNKNTHNYKPGKVKNKAEELKHNHLWIDNL